MSWSPPTKVISDIGIVAIRQRLQQRGVVATAPEQLSFSWSQLALSVGRTQTLAHALAKLPRAQRHTLVMTLGQPVLFQLGIFVEQGAKFSITAQINDLLADEARTSLASKVGAGIADLMMERLGYCWRANAREMRLVPAKRALFPKKIPDFVYHGFEPGNLVVVEAKGSLSTTRAKRERILALAQRAYNEQVRAFVGQKTDDVVVANGYAVAFGAIPGKRSSTIAIATPQKLKVGVPRVFQAASLSAAASGVFRSVPLQQQKIQEQQQQLLQQQQQKMQKQREQEEQPKQESLADKPPDGGDRGPDDEGPGEGGRGRPNGRVAFANYEGVFQLCGAWAVADLIRHILSGAAEESLSEEIVQRFWVVGGSQRFLVGEDDQRSWWWPHGVFAIYERSARVILQAVADNLSSPPVSVSVPIVPDELRHSPDEEVQALQADGLALITPYGPWRSMRWSSRSGWID
jgi:hypothetical protein